MRFFPILSFLVITIASLHAQTAASAFSTGQGVNGQVFAMVVLADGKIVVGGNFTAVNGMPRQNIARLNSDGSLDLAFAQPTEAGVNGPVLALLALADGSVVVGGDFTSAGNLERTDLARFRADGTPDASFGTAEGGVATNGMISALALEANGYIVIGGNFTMVFGQPRRSVARLDASGNVTSENAAQVPLDGSVRAISPLPSGGVLLGGQFQVSSQAARNLAVFTK